MEQISPGTSQSALDVVEFRGEILNISDMGIFCQNSDMSVFVKRGLASGKLLLCISSLRR